MQSLMSVAQLMIVSAACYKAKKIGEALSVQLNGLEGRSRTTLLAIFFTQLDVQQVLT